MSINRRGFLKLTAGAAGVALAAENAHPRARSDSVKDNPFAGLKRMTDGIVPITDEERQARVEKARRLMAENKIDAICLEGGSSLDYFTGVKWWNSERLFAWILPARGQMAWVCPKFEEDRAREQIRFAADVRTWEEDESPHQRIAEVLTGLGIRTGKLGMEEQVRFFVFDGIRKAAPGLDCVNAVSVTAGCRVVKSPAELALMQRANDITVEAFKAVLPFLREGMTKDEFKADAQAAFSALGVSGGIGASFGEHSSFPHGSIMPRSLRKGDIVLMDGGCTVEGYHSDITRTVVFGEPTAKQKEIWELEKKAQLAGFKAAGPGVPCEAVDIAARKVITAAGFGPDYRVPGLAHRTGHGIGLDGHEWTYLVRGNTTPMRPGMCFTDEPMIVIPGEFGIRLEDAFYVTGDGAKFFTALSPSIEQPFE